MVPILLAQLSPPQTEVWTLVLGGDVMLNGIQPKVKPFSGIAKATSHADLAIANLEIPLTDSRQATSRKTREELKKRHQFILKADPKHIGNFADAGFDLVSLANNHAMDYGWSGLSQMQGLLRRRGIAYTGADRNVGLASEPVVYKTRGGTRVALVSYLAFMSHGALWKCTPAGESSPGVAALSFGGTVGDKARKAVEDIVQRARDVGDVVIVALHWGLERKTIPTPYQVALGRAFADAGADIVWGHHPHVLQGWERHGESLILYSMGNLVSPKAGSTGLVEVTFMGAKRLAQKFIPARIAGGKVTLAEGPAGRSISQHFSSISSQLRRRYPVEQRRTSR